MRVMLFALTGFGNKAIDALLLRGCEICGLSTRKESHKYPYYEEINITEYASSKGIPVFEDCEWIDVGSFMRCTCPDLLLVCTYHKIIPDDIIALAKRAVNIHPSLLPKYKGKDPIVDVLEMKECETGVSVHLLTSEIDSGEIIAQEKIKINDGETVETLRERLSHLSAEVIKKLVKDLE